MFDVYRPTLLTALLGIAIGLLPIGCGDIDVSNPTAHVRVVMSGVSTQSNVADFVLYSDNYYNFYASGVADTDSADITLTVCDRQDNEIASVQVSVPLDGANAEDGDTGAGSATNVFVDDGEQSVSIAFHWQGSTPSADVGVDLSFYDDPDIIAWTYSPIPPVSPGTSVYVEVEAVNNEGSQSELAVKSQFVDWDDGQVISTVVLALDTDGLFKGSISAPRYAGDYLLRVVATDNTDGITQDETIYTIR